MDNDKNFDFIINFFSENSYSFITENDNVIKKIFICNEISLIDFYFLNKKYFIDKKDIIDLEKYEEIIGRLTNFLANENEIFKMFESFKKSLVKLSQSSFNNIKFKSVLNEFGFFDTKQIFLFLLKKDLIINKGLYFKLNNEHLMIDNLMHYKKEINKFDCLKVQNEDYIKKFSSVTSYIQYVLNNKILFSKKEIKTVLIVNDLISSTNKLKKYEIQKKYNIKHVNNWISNFNKMKKILPENFLVEYFEKFKFDFKNFSLNLNMSQESYNYLNLIRNNPIRLLEDKYGNDIWTEIKNKLVNEFYINFEKPPFEADVLKEHKITIEDLIKNEQFIKKYQKKNSYNILLSRIEGKTLEEISNIFSLTKETIIKKSIKFLNN